MSGKVPRLAETISPGRRRDMEPFFTRFTRKCQLTAASALPERILIWPKGTQPVTLTEHFLKESITNRIHSEPNIFLIKCLAISRHRSASYSKLNALPHFLLKSCKLNTSELIGEKKRERQRHLLPTPHPPPAS